MELNLKSKDNAEQIVWICDYRHLHIHQKAIRHVKPTKGILKPREYISWSLLKYNFVPLKKDGTPKAKGINLEDNTGYTTAVKVFTTEEECRKEYREMAKKVLQDYKAFYKSVALEYLKLHENFQKL